MTEMAGIETTGTTGAGVTYLGVIAVEWPQPRPGYEYAPMGGHSIAVFDALSGLPITTVTHLEIHAPANGLVTADVTMFTDADGKPLMDLKRVPNPGGGWSQVIYLRDGEMSKGIATGTFPFLVAEMRIRAAEPGRAPLAPRFQEPCPS